MKIINFIKTVIIVQIIISGSAFAEEKQRNDLEVSNSSNQNMIDAKGRKITIVNFEDAIIEGQARSPEGFVLQSRMPGALRSILELRRDFRSYVEADGIGLAPVVTVGR